MSTLAIRVIACCFNRLSHEYTVFASTSTHPIPHIVEKENKNEKYSNAYFFCLPAATGYDLVIQIKSLKIFTVYMKRCLLLTLPVRACVCASVRAHKRMSARGYNQQSSFVLIIQLMLENF